MKTLLTTTKAFLIAASLYFNVALLADQADVVRAIQDPNERILAEMATLTGERTIATAQEELRQSVAEDPDGIRLFRVIFNDAQLMADTAAVTSSFEYVQSIVSKKFDPIENLVWTSSFSDFEMYKGSAIERLKFFERRLAFQRRAIEMTVVVDLSGLPPASMDVYSIEGFATYTAMKTLVDERASSILDVRDLGGRGLWNRIAAFLEQYVAEAIPDLPVP